MDKWFNNKWFVRGLSLAFAILMYVFVSVEANTTTLDSRFIPSASEEYQVLENVPVDIKIDSDRFVVSGVPEVVTLTLEGAHSVVTPIAKQLNFDVFVDLRDLEEGEHVVEIEHARIPEELSVFIEPKTIDITIEERASKEFQVQVDYMNLGDLPVGYELGEVTVNPEVVTITSSKSVIEQITMVKVFIDVAGLTDSVTNREVPINVYDTQGNSLNVHMEPENVVVSVEVDNPSKMVEIDVQTVNDLPEGYKLLSVTPDISEVEVFATRATLEGIERIETEEIDLSEITETGEFEVALLQPDQSTIATETITVHVELEQTKTFDDEVKIELDNQANDQEIAFKNENDQTVSIKVVGNEKDVKELTEEDFRVFIDVKGLDEGEHQVPVSIEGPENVTYTTDLERVTIEVSS